MNGARKALKLQRWEIASTRITVYFHRFAVNTSAWWQRRHYLHWNRHLILAPAQGCWQRCLRSGVSNTLLLQSLIHAHWSVHVPTLPAWGWANRWRLWKPTYSLPGRLHLLSATPPGSLDVQARPWNRQFMTL